jgi:hypothetical protein
MRSPFIKITSRWLLLILTSISFFTSVHASPVHSTWPQALQIWQNILPVLKQNMATQLRNHDTLSSLYSTQYALMNFAIRARREKDVLALSELSELAMIPMQWLVNSSGVGQPTPHSWRDINESLTWADQSPHAGRYDNLNNVVQWMYFTSHLLQSVALIPRSNRTPVMREFLDVYSRLYSFTMNEMIFQSKNRFEWDFRGWKKCSSSQLSHEELTIKKLHRKMNTVAGTPCNAIMDWDLQIWAAALEYRAAVYTDPTSVNYFNDEAKDQKLLGYLRTAFDLVSSRAVSTQVVNFQGRSTPAVVFDLGAWSDHEDFKFAGFTNANRPPNANEASPVKGVGEDLGHHIRYSWVLLSFYENKALIGRAYPQDQDMQLFANQLLFKVYNGNSAQPQFSNFMDGSNGWFRVYPQPGGTVDKGPFGSGNIGFIRGGFGFYQKFQTEMQQPLQAVLRAFTDSSSAGERVRKGLDVGVWKDCQYTRNTWINCKPYSPYLGFGSKDSESLAIFSQIEEIAHQ